MIWRFPFSLRARSASIRSLRRASGCLRNTRFHGSNLAPVPCTVSSSKRVSKSEGTMRYAIVIEKAGNNYSAYVPDLPGCVATGATVEEVEGQIREAIEFHLEGLREDGLVIPQPASRVEYVDVAA